MEIKRSLPEGNPVFEINEDSLQRPLSSTLQTSKTESLQEVKSKERNAKIKRRKLDQENLIPLLVNRYSTCTKKTLPKRLKHYSDYNKRSRTRMLRKDPSGCSNTILLRVRHQKTIVVKTVEFLVMFLCPHFRQILLLNC